MSDSDENVFLCLITGICLTIVFVVMGWHLSSYHQKKLLVESGYSEKIEVVNCKEYTIWVKNCECKEKECE